MKQTNSPILAISMGDPAGIGGDIILKAWARRSGTDPFFIIDDPDRLRKINSETKIKIPIQIINSPMETLKVFSKGLPVFPISLITPLLAPIIPGHPDPQNSKAVIASIEFAVKLIQEKKADAIVTIPIHKKTLYDYGFTYPGQTEFLASLAGIQSPPIMMLAADNLRVVPVTIHQSLKDAIDSLDTKSIIKACQITTASLIKDFGITKPRIAVAGLNPHAGDNGAIGNEEINIITPAIKELQKSGIDVFGPVSPDSLFTKLSRRK